MSEAAPPAKLDATQPGAPALVESLWRFLASLRLTVGCLLTLAFAGVLGQFVNPGHSAQPEIEKAFAGHWFTLEAWRWLELYDLFHSWWFTLLFAALLVNLFARAVERLPRTWLELRHPEVRLDKLGAVGARATLARSEEPAAALARAEALLRAQGYEVALPASAPGDAALRLFAERGRHVRFGEGLVYLGLFVLLGGALFGRLAGFSGLTELSQGGGETDAFQRLRPDGALVKKKLVDPESGQGLVLRCDDLRVVETAGAPGAAEGDFSLFEKQGESALGRQLRKQTVSASSPLEYGGYAIALSSVRQLDEQQRAKIALVEKSSGARHELLLGPGEQFDAADGLRYQLVDYAPDFAGQGPAVQIVRAEFTPGAKPAGEGQPPPDAKLTSFWVFSKAPMFDYKNRADRFAFSFDKLASVYAARLVVSRDPSLPILGLGALLALAGLGLFFSGVHRRVWALAEPGRLSLAGAAQRRPAAFAAEFAALQGALDSPAPPTTPAQASPTAQAP